MSRLRRYSVGASVVLACSPNLSEEVERCEDPAVNEVASQPLLVYRVKEHETLSQIAEAFHLKDGVAQLASLNHLNNPNLIRAGAGLLLPKESPWTDSLEVYQPEMLASPERRYCESKPWSKVEKTRLPSFARGQCKAHTADCASGPNQKVCFCEPQAEGEAGVFLWLEQDSIKAAWPASPSSFYNKAGDTRSFEVSQLDLDQDAKDEVVVFAFESGGRGVPIDTKRVAILSEAQQAPLLWTDDGAIEELFVVGDEGCELQATVWDWYSPQLDVNGLYQKRETYQYQSGALLRSRSFPVIFQRLGAAVWRSWVTHPALSGQGATRAGVIESIESKPALYAVYETTLHIRLSTGELRDFVYQAGFTDSVYDGEWRAIISGIGDKETGTVYPYEYWPADLSQWNGKAVEISVMKYDDSFRNMLWLQ